MNVQELLAEVTNAPVVKRAITNHSTLNEAYDYGSAFSRGMRIDLNGVTILLISGTASIDERGNTVHVGDFRAQQRRTYENITKLLAVRRCHLARHRPHDLLPARYRARLSGLQRRANRFLQRARARPASGIHRNSGDSVPSRSPHRN